MMKKLIPTFSALFIAVASAGAQNGMDVKNIRMERGENDVTLTFEVSAHPGSIGNRNTLTVTPVVADGNETASFASIAVRGRRTAKTAVGQPSTGYVVPAGGSVAYTARIPYQAWMPGAELRLNAVRTQCGSVYAASSVVLADNVLRHEPQYAVEIVATEPEIQPTVGEELSRQYPFLQPSGASTTAFEEIDRALRALPSSSGKPLDAAQRNQLENLIANNRDGSIVVHFRVGNRSVDYDYMDNHRSLVELVSVVRAVEASGTDRVARVVIAGFASPEGDAQLNERLAWDRATALKKFLTDHSAIDPSKISLYNGSVDWPGLRELVAVSEMPDKTKVMEIIDTVPVWDAQAGRGRRGELMRLAQGNPYRYIAREFFPLMRQASFIKVFYEKK